MTRGRGWSPWWHTAARGTSRPSGRWGSAGSAVGGRRWVGAAATRAGRATIGPPQPAAFVDPDTWIARFGELPLLAQSGERWLYNTGAHVLSVLCARAAGMSYDEVLRTRIFEPLGM